MNTDNSDLARLDMLSLVLNLLLYDATIQPSSPHITVAWALAVLVWSNWGILLKDIPVILSQEALCLQLAQKIPSAHLPMKGFWHEYWLLPLDERLAIELFVTDRVQLLLHKFAEHWKKEISSL